MVDQMKSEKIMRAFNGAAEYYDQYMEDTGHTKAQRRIARFIARNNTGKVLDVASGTGIMLEPFEDGVGVDISPRLTREAKRKTVARFYRCRCPSPAIQRQSIRSRC